MACDANENLFAAEDIREFGAMLGLKEYEIDYLEFLRLKRVLGKHWG